MPSRVLDFKTPLQVLSPPYSTSKCVSPKVFGCVCFVHVHGPTWGKLDPRALKCVFVILPHRRGTNVITPHRENNLSQWMSLSLKHYLKSAKFYIIQAS
jgi:hypothetical protein